MSPENLKQLEQTLPDYIRAQRWYRAKARTIKELHIQDAIPMKTTGSQIFIVRIEYTEGESDTYLLPLTTTGDKPQDALGQAGFRDSLLDAIACERTFEGREGSLTASRTSALKRSCDDSAPKLESSVSRAEQSNSSIIFGDQFILKIFRKLESGVNPDLEIGRFLTERGFKYTPAVLGQLEYRPKRGDPMHAAILQGFVHNHGDAWKYTLESLKPFFVRALQNGSAPVLDTYHPMELCRQELPAIARQTIGEYIESARLLGARTAQMHAALTDPQAGSDFAPERFTPDYAGHLYQEMLNQFETTFDLVQDKQNMLSGEAAESARQLIAAEPKVRHRFSSLRAHEITAVRIRHHGDFHLGQVLYTGTDFIIIDFEGEPARPLAHRRIKTLAMRDVAGMIRSFSYAAYAAMEPEARDRTEPWASFWAAWVSAEYLKAYFETAANSDFVGNSESERRILFDAFVLQKALYEVSYELNNRPDWVQIPLRGILNLVD
jgi:maltose alpha-D-glucosyltransferase / alpha-amylase